MRVTGKIGFYGCSAGGGRIVRAKLRGKGTPPRSAKVDCPACGNTHLAEVAWRQPTPMDKDREADVTIDAKPKAMD